jgi:hypothetical protein
VAGLMFIMMRKVGVVDSRLLWWLFRYLFGLGLIVTIAITVTITVTLFIIGI